MKLNDAILTTLDNIETQGFIQQTIEDALKKTIKDLINDQLRSYSDLIFDEGLEADDYYGYTTYHGEY